MHSALTLTTFLHSIFVFVLCVRTHVVKPPDFHLILEKSHINKFINLNKYFLYLFLGWGDIICWGVNFFYQKPTFKKISLINFCKRKYFSFITSINLNVNVLLQIDINSNREVGILFLPYRNWQLLNWRMIERLLNWRINLHLKKWVCFIFTFLFLYFFYIYFFLLAMHVLISQILTCHGSGLCL